MHPKRRSGRIPKELPIVLLGTDTAGKVFAEQTKTVVLSRHGAGVISKYRFAPDEVLTLRLVGSAKEAEVRLVGQIGGEPGRYVHGLTFVDPNLEFWPMEFPPPAAFEPASRLLTLACTLCDARQTAEPDEIEEDVFSVNGNLLRFCVQCGTSTPWKKARGEYAASQSAGTLRQISPTPILHSGPSAADSSYSSAALDTLPTAAAGIAVAEPPAAADKSQLGLAPSLSPRPTTAAVAESAGRPADAHGRPLNRRKHMRVRVNFNACIRQGDSPDEIVECENISKGGLCFHSCKEYSLDSLIQVAAPFAPGEPALFVPAKVRRAELLPGSQVFRYGVAYVASDPAAPVF